MSNLSAATLFISEVSNSCYQALFQFPINSVKIIASYLNVIYFPCN